MAQIETVKTAAETNTALDDGTLNPTVDNAQSRARTIVHVDLVFDGIDFDPSDLFDALDAEWGTVATDDAQPSRNCFRFIIS